MNSTSREFPAQGGSNQSSKILTLSLMTHWPISPISSKCQMLKKSLSEIKAILHLFLF
jgi:hypothetical protein